MARHLSALAMGFAAVVFAVLSPISVATAEDTTVTLEHAVSFRQAFGLRADSPYVQDSLTNVGKFPNDDWGVPLTTPEATDMFSRVQVQRAIRGPDKDLWSNQDYGGMYLDQARGGIPVFLTTGSVDALSSQLQKEMPEIQFEVHHVDNTLAQLTSTKDAISDSRDELTADGVIVHSASVDVVNNQVIVGVDRVSDAARKALDTFGPAVVLYEDTAKTNDSCTMSSCGPDMKGGLEIESSVPNICTSGYVANREDTDPNYIVLVTAGHCIKDGGTSDSWSHDSHTIGPEDSHHGYHDGSYGDVGFIKLNSASNPKKLGVNANQLLATPSTGQVVQITSLVIWGSQHVGDTVCRVGWGSKQLHGSTPPAWHADYLGKSCGKINLYNSDSDGTSDADSESCLSACIYVREMKVVGFDSTGGDSGGTVFEPVSGTDTETGLLGTHVHSVTDGPSANDPNGLDGWYTTYDNGQTELESEGPILIPCYTPGC